MIAEELESSVEILGKILFTDDECYELEYKT